MLLCTKLCKDLNYYKHCPRGVLIIIVRIFNIDQTIDTHGYKEYLHAVAQKCTIRHTYTSV